MPWLAAAAVAAPIVGGIIGQQAAKGDRAAQKQASKEAIAALNSLGFPPDLSREIIVEEMQRQGVYTPEIEQDLADSFAESEMTKVQEDPGLKQAQMQALASMQNRAKVGLSAEDRASLNQVRSEVQRDAEAKRQQVLQQMQSRGMGGYGAALIAQLQAGQSGADLASQQSDQLMAQAQQRALQALGQSGQMAGQMQEAQFGRQADIAKSVDERNRFLQENSIARQTRNVSSLNAAQAANLAEQQRLHEANIAARRAEAERQSKEQGSQFDRGLELAKAKSNAYTGQAQQAGQSAAATAKGYADMGTGVGSALTGIGSTDKGAFSKLFGAAGGGIVGDPETTGPGATAGPDETIMKMRDGEMVLNADQQRGLFDFINRISNKYK